MIRYRRPFSILVTTLGCAFFLFRIFGGNNSQQYRIENLRAEMATLEHCIFEMNTVPNNDLQLTIRNCAPRGMRHIRSGFDPWGSPIRFSVDLVEKTSSYCVYYVSVVSFGPNCRDDHGRQDDIGINFYIALEAVHCETN